MPRVLEATTGSSRIGGQRPFSFGVPLRPEGSKARGPGCGRWGTGRRSFLREGDPRDLKREFNPEMKREKETQRV